MASRLWRFLTTDISELLSGETASSTAEAAEAVFELAEVLEKEGPNVQKLAPLVGQLDSLLDALNSPLAEIVEKSLPFVSIATGLLKFYLEKSKKPLTLANCVAIASQAAYLQSFRRFLEEDEGLRQQIGRVPASAEVAGKARRLGELEISDEEARRAATSFPRCELARRFGEVLTARLVQAGLEAELAHRLAERVKWRSPRYLNEVWAASAEAVKHLGQPTFENWRQEQAKYLSIEDYLREQIAPGPLEQVFDEEDLSFCDIYVPLQIKWLDGQQDPPKDKHQDLQDWVIRHLMRSKDTNRILFIDGEAGRGKSVFCCMFADWTRRNLYPAYIPLLVRLRHIKALESSLTQTLSNYLQNQDFVSSDSGWLTDKNTRFLFFLDGFDELLLEGRESGGLKEFLQQVEQFQRNTHHRFVLTGRPLSLQHVGRLISQTDNLERLNLQPMDNALRERWYGNWATKFGPLEAKALKYFLSLCPKDVRNSLAREPLLLYLLGRMHREKRLQADMFDQGVKGIEAKVAIYDEAVRWVIEKQRQDENFRLVGLDREDLRQALTEAAVCVTQSGNEAAKVSFLEARLQQDSNNPVYGLLQTARKEVKVSEQKLLNNLLTTFYLKPASGDKEGSVEFAHKSFGEFLFAERLRDALEDWSKQGQGRRNKYLVSEGDMHWQVYDLVGYGGLTVEVMGYLRVLLDKYSDFEPMALFERLEEFYLRWWQGEFIDAEANNLPQRKMLNLRRRVPEREEPLGLRQVDVVTGLNMMILLLELHRYGWSRDALKHKMTFYPCGKPETEKFERARLCRIIGYGECLRVAGFNSVVGKYLHSVNLHNVDLHNVDFHNANLSNANLSNANLSNANLSGADLFSTNLSGADLFSANLHSTNLRSADLFSAKLRSAKLSSANLGSANLSCTDLVNANLINANLRNTNLRNTNLRNANLRSANLCNANLYNAKLNDIYWDALTKWANAEGLHTVQDTSSELAKTLSFMAAVTLSQGLELAKEGKISEALLAYDEAQAADLNIQISTRSWDTLCWYGSIYGCTENVIYAGENAVKLEPDNGRYHETLGLAKGLIGDTDGAIASLQTSIEVSKKHPISLEAQRSRRERWVAALQSGQNPFTPEELASLREAEAIR